MSEKLQIRAAFLYELKHWASTVEIYEHLCVHLDMNTIAKKNSYGCYEKSRGEILIRIMSKGRPLFTENG